MRVVWVVLASGRANKLVVHTPWRINRDTHQSTGKGSIGELRAVSGL